MLSLCMATNDKTTGGYSAVGAPCNQRNMARSKRIQICNGSGNVTDKLHLLWRNEAATKAKLNKR
jgi:hypothetical protein